MKQRVGDDRQGISRLVTPFLLITFGLTWGLGALALAFPETITSLFGEFNTRNPLFVAAVYSPAIAGVLLVLLKFGVRGLVGYLRRFLRGKTSFVWWALIVVGVPGVMYAGALIKGAGIDPFPYDSAGGAAGALLLALFLGPIEELGWRGFLLPLLNRRLRPLVAATVVGVIWMVWHIPAFLIGGTPQSGWAFLPFLIGGIGISIIMAVIFNESRGSLLLACLFHFQLNNPLWPDAQPWDSYLIGIAALVVVIAKGRQLLSRDYGYRGIVE